MVATLQHLIEQHALEHCELCQARPSKPDSLIWEHGLELNVCRNCLAGLESLGDGLGE